MRCSHRSKYMRPLFERMRAGKSILQVGLFQLSRLGAELKQSETIMAQAVEYPAVPGCFEVAMADNAYE